MKEREGEGRGGEGREEERGRRRRGEGRSSSMYLSQSYSQRMGDIGLSNSPSVGVCAIVGFTGMSLCWQPQSVEQGST